MKPIEFVYYMRGMVESVSNSISPELKDKILDKIKIVIDTQALRNIHKEEETIPKLLDWLGDSKQACKFPMDCGLPTVWHGVVPPICTKCGFGSVTQTHVTYDNTAYSTSHGDEDLITIDLKGDVALQKSSYDCEESPIGKCVHMMDGREGECIFCGGPEERK